MLNIFCFLFVTLTFGGILDSSSFGKAARRYFNHARKVIHFNSGGVGTPPKYVIQKSEAKRREINKNYNNFIINEYAIDGLTLEGILANYLSIPNFLDLVFIETASDGISSVFTSLAPYLYANQCLGNGNVQNRSTPNGNGICKILRFNTGHISVINTLDYVNSNILSTDDQIIVFDVTIEMLNNQTLLVNELEKLIQNEMSLNNRIYMGIFSHIISFPSVILDPELLCNLFLKYDIISVVDGAQALGGIPLDFSSDALNQCDIYIMTGYKWFYGLRGTGLMYVKNDEKNLQNSIVPSITNLQFNQPTQFQGYFAYVGLKDLVPIYSLQYALEFRQQLGESNIISYNHQLCVEGAEIINNLWNTESYVSDTSLISTMATIISPTQDPIEFVHLATVSNENDYWMRWDQFNGVFGVRFSCQIFTRLKDFEKVGKFVLEELELFRQGKE